jgi:hypothetical protein
MLVASTVASAQNLVPNASFEVMTSCPGAGNEVHFAVPWFNPTLASPDYFNSCDTIFGFGVPSNLFGNASAFQGSAYAGIVTIVPGSTKDYREYVQVRLVQPLMHGTRYCVSFLVRLADSAAYACDNIGVLFRKDILLDSTTNEVLHQTTQAENEAGNSLSSKGVWHRVRGSFIADGGEFYVTIGNFRDSAASTYMAAGDGATWASWAYYYVDSVTVSACNPSGTAHLPATYVGPNPARDKITVYTVQHEVREVAITTSAGQVISVKNYPHFGPAVLDVSHLPSGSYVLVVTSSNHHNHHHFVKL